MVKRSNVAGLLLLVVVCIASAEIALGNDGYNLTPELWAKAVLKTPSKDVTLVWSEVGSDTTPSGDRVVSGYFYADPDDFAYGSVYNPEVFVKVYIATNGWSNIAFNHVTVDDVDVSSALIVNGSELESKAGTITLDDRLDEHSYMIPIDENFDGTWTGSSTATTPTGYDGNECGPATITMVISNGQIISGSVLDSYGHSIPINSGTVQDNGTLYGEGEAGPLTAIFTGVLSTNGTGSGAYIHSLGCQGEWTLTKEN